MSCFTCQNNLYFCPHSLEIYTSLPQSTELSGVRGRNIFYLCCSFTFTFTFKSPSNPHPVTGQWREMYQTYVLTSLAICPLLLLACSLHCSIPSRLLMLLLPPSFGALLYRDCKGLPPSQTKVLTMLYLIIKSINGCIADYYINGSILYQFGVQL